MAWNEMTKLEMDLVRFNRCCIRKERERERASLDQRAGCNAVMLFILENAHQS